MVKLVDLITFDPEVDSPGTLAVFYTYFGCRIEWFCSGLLSVSRSTDIAFSTTVSCISLGIRVGIPIPSKTNFSCNVPTKQKQNIPECEGCYRQYGKVKISTAFSALSAVTFPSEKWQSDSIKRWTILRAICSVGLTQI
jgi:hypothetical protein